MAWVGKAKLLFSDDRFPTRPPLATLRVSQLAGVRFTDELSRSNLSHGVHAVRRGRS